MDPSLTNLKKGDFVRAKKTISGLLTGGKIYEVLSYLAQSDLVDVVTDSGVTNGYYSWRFELIKNNELSFETQFELAKSYIDKCIIYDGEEYMVGNFEIFSKYSGAPCSTLITRALEKNPWVFGFYSMHKTDSFKNKFIPLELIEGFAPEYKELKLNEKHTARVFGDRVEVGCQTFSLEAIRELGELVKAK